MRSRWIWDERGSDLYGRIMVLPQYYLPGAEREIAEIVGAPPKPQLEAAIQCGR